MIEQRPAGRACVMAYLAGIGVETPPRRELAGLLIQIAAGRAWSFRPAPDAPPCALGGIVHAGAESEAWFLAGREADRHLLALVRLFRHQVAADCRLIGRPVVTRTHEFNPAGRRLARLLGFRDGGRREGRIMIWELKA